MKIALIGFGEVGQTFAADFLKRDGVIVSAYDLLFSDPASQLRTRAEALGVKTEDGAAEAAEGACVVISAVTADRCEAAAAAAADYLEPAQIFFDVNSASPQTKRRAAARIAARGGSYVEGAVMAAVLAPRLAVPILGGGERAEELAALLNPLGMNITPVAREIGEASSTKLCRSIMIKGIEALICDCAAAAKKAGVEKAVYASLAETFPSIDWQRLAESMAERVAKHGIRRAAEMREAAEMLTEMEIESSLARAVADAQERGALMHKRNQSGI